MHINENSNEEILATNNISVLHVLPYFLQNKFRAALFAQNKNPELLYVYTRNVPENAHVF